MVILATSASHFFNKSLNARINYKKTPLENGRPLPYITEWTVASDQRLADTIPKMKKK